MQKDESTRLQEVKSKFKNWRANRTKATLSNELWREAASLVGEFPVTRVCRELKLHPDYLKRWVKGGEPSRKQSKKRDPKKFGFVELPQLTSLPIGAAGTRGIQIQLEGRVGARVRMIVPSEGSAPWDEIFSAWLRAEEKAVGGARV